MNRKKMTFFIMIVLFFVLPLTASASTHTRGQIVQFGNPVSVEQDEVILGDVVSFFGAATIRGRVEGDVVGIFSPIYVIGGEVTGDTVAIFGPVSLEEAALGNDAISIFGGLSAGPGTAIDGSAVAVMGSGLDVRQAAIAGDRIDVAGFLPGSISGFTVLGILFAALMIVKQIIAFIVGVLAIVIFPDRFERMADHAFEDMGRKTMIGLLVNLGVFVLIVILAVTVVGAMLIPLVFPAFMLLEFAGNTTMKMAFGRKIADGMGQQWGSILELFIGTLLFLILDITLVGKLFTFIFKLMGMGMVVDSRLGDQLPRQTQGGLVHES